MLKVFISYSVKDKNYANKLAYSLREKNIQVFFSEWDILVGHNLEHQLYEGIKECNYLLLIITKSSIKSKWVKVELDFARIIEIEDNRINIIPLLYEKCEIPDSLRTKVYADFTDSFDIGFNKILHTISNAENNIPVHSKIGSDFDNIFKGLVTPDKLRRTFFNGAYFIDKELIEPDITKSVIGGLDILIDFAQSFNVPNVCWEWLEWYKNALLSGLLNKLFKSRKMSDRKVFLEKCFYGRPMYRGGIACRLPLLTKISFELGKKFDGEYEDEIGKNKLINICSEINEKLNFSSDFLNNIELHPEDEQYMFHVYSALSYELLSYSDYNKLFSYLNQILSEKAILSGYYLTTPPFVHLDEYKFIERSNIITEYILSELDAIDEAQSIIKIAYDVTFAKKIKGKSKRDSAVYKTYENVWADLNSKAEKLKNINESVNWFLLSLKLGQLFFIEVFETGKFKNKKYEEIDVVLIDEIKHLAQKLVKDYKIIDQINTFCQNTFYLKSEIDSLDKLQLHIVSDLIKYVRQKL